MKHNFASKKGLKALSFYCITLMLICQVVALFGGAKTAQAKDVDNFSFKDFTADYYLKKADDGSSILQVKEVFTAEFPNYNQNKGICRKIPFSMKSGGRPVYIIKGLSKTDVKLTRNGKAEPIYSIEKEDKYYEICTGDDDYVLGEQVYAFEYKYENVITYYNNGSKEWDELYWDTNGTGWPQKFGSVTARLHFEDPSVWTGEKWCYVGRSGSTNQSRCQISEIEDGVQFVATDLSAGENLTFDVELKPGSYVVLQPEETNIMLYIFIVFVAVMVFVNYRTFKKYNSVSEKRDYYKGRFVTPEYEPNAKYGIMEMAANYIGHAKKPNTALLLKMIVDGRIELVKGEKNWFLGKIGWKIRPKNLTNLEADERALLRILNGGPEPKMGTDIELRRRTATSTLVSLGRSLENYGSSQAKTHGLFEQTKSYKSTGLTAAITILVIYMCLPVIILFVLGILADSLSEGDLAYTILPGKVLVGLYEALAAGAVITVATLIVRSIVTHSVKKYEKRTKLGLEMSRYMDGLCLYIAMAEKDRLKFLQSVEGADVSPEGIVKLYEKLLPYAALFGLEKSWMEELQEYSEVHEIETPTWYTTNIAAVSSISQFSSIISSASSISTSSTTYSSSGSSGGGGGGSSGGGGGGGGGGGR